MPNESTAAPQAVGPARHDTSLLMEQDFHLFNEGTHSRMYEKMGAHLGEVEGEPGCYFSVWAPNAREVSVIGDFNDWAPAAHYLHARGLSGIWECFIPGVTTGMRYKYLIVSHNGGFKTEKADPYGFTCEHPPHTASRVCELDYKWQDAKWMAERKQHNALDAPMSIYEMHVGSWMHRKEDPKHLLSYREIAAPLCEYLSKMYYTHVELMPVMEHPYYASWGYQTTGYFAPSIRYGTPQDFMYLVDQLHQAGIGVLLDWVPSHFPNDGHGLTYFDGTALYEHEDPRLGFHPDWKTCIFNYGRNEVRSFLVSSGIFWLDKYHADGLRVDAVASMLYLDYSRKAGEWIPNRYGGRENIEAIDFLRQLNASIYESFPDTQTIAEESTAWPMVSRPAYVGGLGFGLKWDMGWMHDTLKYMEQNPIYRRFHHNKLTFRMLYGFSENFVLPLSHDEVVHGKGSLLGKMPGDEWQRFANLRCLFGVMFAQPAKKMVFMGGEIGQYREWAHEGELDWNLLDFPLHRGIQSWVRDLNHAYAAVPALHVLDVRPEGFEWVDCNDNEASIISLLRWGPQAESTGSPAGDSPRDAVLVALNFTPVPRSGYRIGVPRGGFWKELLNSDAKDYGGSGMGNFGGLEAEAVEHHGRPYSLVLTLPPLSAVFMRWQPQAVSDAASSPNTSEWV